MDAGGLRRIFKALLRTSLVSPVALGGCGPDLSGYEPVACGSEGLVGQLSPAVIPDVIELRALAHFREDDSAFVIGATGDACATATDKQACEDAIAAQTPEQGFRHSCLDICQSYLLVATTGDQVQVVTSVEELRAFLGSIDTPQEAALLAFANGYNLQNCADVSRGGVRVNEDGSFNVIGTTGYACGRGTKLMQHTVRVSSEGEVTTEDERVLERGSPNCVVGRRPVGLRVSAACDGSGAVGDYFAQMATLEAAAVNAFVRLRDELALHGAPRALQQEALLSAVEEVGHAELARALAAQHGVTPKAPEVESLPLRSLWEVALDNRVEGCVRETWGALVAHHQALHASDSQTRQVMARIAEEETRHAALSWKVDAWVRTRLSPEELAALDREAERAAQALREEAGCVLDPEVTKAAGLPLPEEASVLVASLTQQLAAAA